MDTKSASTLTAQRSTSPDGKSHTRCAQPTAKTLSTDAKSLTPTKSPRLPDSKSAKTTPKPLASPTSGKPPTPSAQVSKPTASTSEKKSPDSSTSVSNRSDKSPQGVVRAETLDRATEVSKMKFLQEPFSAGSSASRSQDVDKLSVEEQKRVYKRFKKIDADGSGKIEFDEFATAANIESTDFLKRLFAVLDVDTNGDIDYHEFIDAIATFCTREDGDANEKYRTLFKVYDFNDDGVISNGDLYRVSEMVYAAPKSEQEMVKTKKKLVLKDSDLQAIVDKTLLRLTGSVYGTINFEKFVELCKGQSLFTSFVFDV